MLTGQFLDKENNLKPETLDRYLDILIKQKAAKKPKDWVEAWAAMDIPPTHQAVVMEPILRYGLEHTPATFGKILATLIIGHRVKTNAMTDSIRGAFAGQEDTHGVLREMLFLIYPKGPHSEWGWSRVGWSWQEWWKVLERSYEGVAEASAFDELSALLNKIEAEGGSPLAKQTQIWTDLRLSKAKALLCKFGGVEDESDLVACLDATLS